MSIASRNAQKIDLKLIISSKKETAILLEKRYPKINNFFLMLHKTIRQLWRYENCIFIQNYLIYEWNSRY